MAKDWIKMRMDLPSHPKVVRILSATKSDKFRVIGGLHAVWSVFDVHSEDGSLNGYTPETMDHIIGWDGFCSAMMAVGWLDYDGSETLAMPDFDTHNGQSAKRRADETERKRKERNSADKLRTSCGQTEDKKRSREEESRGEESKEKDNVASKDATNDYSPEFEQAWKAYPKRHTSSNKKATYKQWKARINNGFMPDDIMRGIERYAKFCKAERQVGTKFVKMPETFLGPNEHFMEEWKVSNSEVRSDPFSDRPTSDQIAELKRNLGMQ